ncbi:hypothetical protein GCM10020255_085040 [Rhodococcus baikonurensis]
MEESDVEPLTTLRRSGRAAGAAYQPCVPVSSELERTLIEFAANSLEDARPVHIELPVHNTDRAVGTRLGAELTRRYGAGGLPEGTIDIVLSGTAGQSLGAFLPPGILLVVVGDANDYVGKGLSGGRIVLRPSEDAPFVAEEQVIAAILCCTALRAVHSMSGGVSGNDSQCATRARSLWWKASATMRVST